jgi:hypothetical protein
MLRPVTEAGNTVVDPLEPAAVRLRARPLPRGAGPLREGTPQAVRGRDCPEGIRQPRQCRKRQRSLSRYPPAEATPRSRCDRGRNALTVGAATGRELPLDMDNLGTRRAAG